MFKIFYKTPIAMTNLRNQLLRVFTSRRDSNYGAVMPFSTAFQVNSADVEAYYSKASKYTTNDSKMTAILALDFMRLDTETEKRLALAEKETEKRLAEKETEKRLALAEKETEKRLAEAQTQNSQRESYLKSLLSAVSQRYCSLLNAKNFHLKTYRLYEPFPSLLVIDMY